MATNIDDHEGQNLQGASLTDRLLHIGKQCSAHLNELFRSVDHGTLLYDEMGLPQPRRWANPSFTKAKISSTRISPRRSN